MQFTAGTSREITGRDQRSRCVQLQNTSAVPLISRERARSQPAQVISVQAAMPDQQVRDRRDAASFLFS
jgi:hypothetical protein